MKKWLIIVVVLCFSSGGGWWLWAQSQPDPQVEEVKALIPKDISKVPAEKRRETFAKVREKMEQLTPQQRNEVFKDRRKGMTDRIRTYSKLTPKEKTAFLDKSIDEMEARMKQWKKRRAERKSQESSSNADSSKKNERKRGGRRSRDSSKEGKENRKRNRLDSSTPEERAMFTAFIQDMKKRREERGLSSFSRGGFDGPPR